ncbi:MAG TPA: ATP/GTP-binding protein [Actinomycetota bacterium]|nr:ATP/GTP-binding protein [Actinomycetota bacterium]
MPSRTRRGGSGPWKNKAAGDLDIGKLEESLLGPASGRIAGYEVRRTANQPKRYRCPYCEGWVEEGSPHLVAFPSGRPEERRHYHTACWSRQANTGGGRRSRA